MNDTLVDRIADGIITRVFGSVTFEPKDESDRQVAEYAAQVFRQAVRNMIIRVITDEVNR